MAWGYDIASVGERPTSVHGGGWTRWQGAGAQRQQRWQIDRRAGRRSGRRRDEICIESSERINTFRRWHTPIRERRKPQDPLSQARSQFDLQQTPCPTPLRTDFALTRTCQQSRSRHVYIAPAAKNQDGVSLNTPRSTAQRLRVVQKAPPYEERVVVDARYSPGWYEGTGRGVVAPPALPNPAPTHCLRCVYDLEAKQGRFREECR